MEVKDPIQYPPRLFRNFHTTPPELCSDGEDSETKGTLLVSYQEDCRQS